MERFLQRRRARPATPTVAHDERHDERDQEQEEQDLRDARSGSREAGKAEDGREDGDDEKSDRPAKHRASRQLDGWLSGANALPLCTCGTRSGIRERVRATTAAFMFSSPPMERKTSVASVPPLG